jgi:hypothetical protein
MALRSMAWNTKPTSATHIAHAIQIVAGVGLGLMGLLDIGSKRATLDGSDGLNHHLNPLYVSLQAKLPLVVVLAVYSAVSLGSAILARFKSRKGRSR